MSQLTVSKNLEFNVIFQSMILIWNWYFNTYSTEEIRKRENIYIYICKYVTAH